MIEKYQSFGHGKARVIEVIETTLEKRGKGVTDDSPMRYIVQYWSLDGILLAERDPISGDRTA